MNNWSTDSNWYYCFMVLAMLFVYCYADMRKWKKGYFWMKGLFLHMEERYNELKNKP